MLPEMETLIHSLDRVLSRAWEEANERDDVSVDDLVNVWERLEAMHQEVGECIHGYAAKRNGNPVERLRGLEVPAHEELRLVQEGVLDGGKPVSNHASTLPKYPDCS